MTRRRSDKSAVTNKNRNKKAEGWVGQGRMSWGSTRAAWDKMKNGEKLNERGINILQEKARPCNALADEYLLESTKD